MLPEVDSNKVNEYLKLDYLSAHNDPNLPKGIEAVLPSGFRSKCFNFLSCRQNITNYIPQFSNYTPKQILKQVHFEVINIENNEVFLFNYLKRNRVSGLYEIIPINI